MVRASRFGLLIFLAACTHEPSAAEREAVAQAQHVREVVAAGGVVDSIVAPAEALARFRASLPAVDTLRHASTSREALVERIARSVGRRDTMDLNALLIDRAEFAWLLYADSPMSKPPYEAPPALLWAQIRTSSDNGARDLIARFGGAAIHVANFACPAPEREGHNRLYKRCTVAFSAPGRPSLAGSLFGTIVERDGRFKLLSFANRI